MLIELLSESTVEFWSQFWPNFISSLAAGIIITWVIALIIKMVRKKSLYLNLKVPKNNENNHLIIRIVNDGKVGFSEKEVYWHIFFDKRINIVETTHQPGPIPHKLGANHFIHFRDLEDKPVFVDSTLECMRVSVQLPQSGVMDIRGYLSTIDGNFPKSLRGRPRKDISLSELPIIGTITPQGIEVNEYQK